MIFLGEKWDRFTMRIFYWFSKIFVIVFLLCGSLNSLAQTCNERVLPVTPDSRFKISGNEAHDLKTGLVWQRCSVGQRWDDSTCLGSPATRTWSGALSLAAGDWRLPNIKELMSIVERACNSPAINLTVFPNTPSGVYWSSSPFSTNNPAYRRWAYVVWFDEGWDSVGYKGSHTQHVRLVRGGQ